MKHGTLKSNFIWNTIGSLVLYGCQWAVSILVVNLSSGAASSNVGLLQLAITVTNTFVSVASYGMRSFQVSDMQQKYATAEYVRSRIITCVAAFGACGVFCAVLSYSAVQTLTILLYLTYRLTESISDVFHGAAQKHDRMDIIGKSYILRAVAGTAAFVITLKITNNIPLTVALMCLAAYTVLFVYEIPACRAFYDGVRRVQHGMVQRLLLECLPLAVYTFLNTAIASTPKLFLEKIAGEEMLGIFNTVTSPVLLLQTAATYLFVPLITHFAYAYANGDKKKFHKMLWLVLGMLLAMLPAGLLVVRYLGVWGLNLLYPAKGMDAYLYLLYPMVLASVLTACVLFFSMILTIMRAMRWLIAANVAGIVVAVACSTPLIAAWEMQGTNYAMILSLFTQAVLLFIAILVRGGSHFKKEFAANDG